MKVNIIESEGFDEYSLRMLQEACRILGSVLGSREFEDAVLGYGHAGEGFHYRRDAAGNWGDTPYTNTYMPS